MRACYVDKVAAFSMCQGFPATQRVLLVSALRAEGIVTHEEEGGDELAFLGFVVQSGAR